MAASKIRKAQLYGFDNVDNTSDVSKPVSTDQQTALNDKVDKVVNKSLLADSEITRLAAITGTNTGDQNLSSYATTAAMDTAIALAAVGLFDDRGTHNASSNAFPIAGGTVGSGPAGQILKGDIWTISTGGVLGGVTVTTGDLVRAIQDDATTLSHFAITENNFGYVAENSDNKVTSIDGSSTDTQYPSAKLVYDKLVLKVTANIDIAAANNKTKISYDAKGLITSGANATTADIDDSNDRRYVTEAQLAQLAVSAKYFRTTVVTVDTTTQLTIANTLSSDSIQVFMNGQLFKVTDDYTLSGVTITLVNASIGSDSFVVYGVH